MQQTTNLQHDANVDEDRTILKLDNPYYNGDHELYGSGEIAVKALENPYYGSDPDLQPESQTIQISNNPYYGVEMNAEITDSNDSEEDNEKNVEMNKEDVTNIEDVLNDISYIIRHTYWEKKINYSESNRYKNIK